MPHPYTAILTDTSYPRTAIFAMSLFVMVAMAGFFFRLGLFFGILLPTKGRHHERLVRRGGL